MKKLLIIGVAVMFLGLLIPQGALADESGTYLGGVKDAYVRGGKNIVSSPMEILRGIRDAKPEKMPLGTHFIGGGVKGISKTLMRCGSGAVDLVAGLVPGHQGGMPVTPET